MHVRLLVADLVDQTHLESGGGVEGQGGTEEVEGVLAAHQLRLLYTYIDRGERIKMGKEQDKEEKKEAASLSASFIRSLATLSLPHLP